MMLKANDYKRPLYLDSGVELWDANYFYTEAPFLSNPNELTEFGNELSEKLEEKRAIICSKVSKFVKDTYKDDTFRSTWKEEESCFENKEISFKDNKYIVFPSFLIKELRDYDLRIRINPCLGRESSQTKIYSIPRYTKQLESTEALVFLERSMTLSKLLLELISKAYQDAYNSCKKAKGPISSMKNPSKLRFIAAGSSTMDSFIELSKQKARFEDYCAMNSEGKKIYEFIVNSAKLIGENVKLSDFQWFRRTISDANQPRKSLSAYFGMYKNKKDNSTSFLVFSNGSPNNIVRNINIPIILEN